MTEGPKRRFGYGGQPPTDQGPTGQRSAFREWIAKWELWQKIVAPIIVVVIAAVIVTALPGHSSPKTVIVPPATSMTVAPKPPQNVIQQVEQRPIWTATPQVFSSAEDTFSIPSVNDEVSVDPTTAQPVVVTPSQLADDAPTYDGQTVILVGRIVSEVAISPPGTLDSLSGVSDEIQLAGSNGSNAYIGSEVGTGDPSTSRGKVVWVPGRIAAVGTTRAVNGPVSRSAYFLAMDNPNVLDGALDNGLPQSIASALRQARKARLS